jgi:hypothetical protein
LEHLRTRDDTRADDEEGRRRLVLVQVVKQERGVG